MSNGTTTTTTPQRVSDEPPPVLAAEASEFVGVSSTYKWRGPRRYTAGWSGGVRTTQEVRPPLYKQDEVLAPASWPDERRAALQNELIAIGLMGPKTRFRAGVWDDTWQSAYRKLLTVANVYGVDKETATQMLAANPQVDADEVIREANVTGGNVGGGAAFDVDLSDPDTLADFADAAATKLLGRDAPEGFRERFVKEIQAEQRRVEEAKNAAGERQRRAEFDARTAAEVDKAVAEAGGGIINPVEGAMAPGGSQVGAPRDGGKRGHMGYDFMDPVSPEGGSKARAPISGTVVKAGSGGARSGNRVTIQGDDGRYHFLAHLKTVSVTKGQRVEQGEPIGIVGKTGNATHSHAHVHYSINSSPNAEDAIGDPAVELRGRKGVVRQPNIYIPPVTTVTEKVDPQASALAAIEKEDPTGVAAHDLATQVQRFMQMLDSPV